MMTQSMGSDFINDDLVKESSALLDYTHEIIGDNFILDRACYTIQLTPKPEAVVWGKIKTFIDKNDFLQLNFEFYDEDGYLINKMASRLNLLGTKYRFKNGITPVEEEGQTYHTSIQIY